MRTVAYQYKALARVLGKGDNSQWALGVAYTATKELTVRGGCCNKRVIGTQEGHGDFYNMMPPPSGECGMASEFLGTACMWFCFSELHSI